MDIGGGEISGAIFNFFVVKKYPFCIFRTLPSVSKIIPVLRNQSNVFTTKIAEKHLWKSVILN